MACDVRSETRDGLMQVCLRSDAVSVVALPEFGGRIWTLVDRRADKQWLWHNQRQPLAPSNLGDTYDDRWSGGWEELFPNDAAGVFENRLLPDHGEWWSARWTWEITESGPDRAQIRLTHQSRSTPTFCEKVITLDGASPVVRVDYRIENQSDDALRFLFKQHLAVAVEPGDVIELPGGVVTAVDPAFGTRLQAPSPCEWQRAGLSLCPPAAAADREFVYVRDLPEGACGVRDPRTGASIRMEYSSKTFPYTWLFMDFGGWRGHYVVVLEPCTNMPKDLSEARRLGQCAMLEPRTALNCTVSVHLQ